MSQKRRILVTGGAGYIGSHFCQLAAGQGHEVLSYDNLSTGHRCFVQWGDLVEADLLETHELMRTLREYQPHVVLHFAGKAIVIESVKHPELYERNNVQGTRSLLQALSQTRPVPIVFSSSCSTYGVHDQPITETSAQSPINPYGESKLACEKMVFDYGQRTAQPYACLRYFNVIGQDPANEIWEDHDPETHIVPNIMRAEVFGETFNVYGGGLPTRDGSCVRDFVDVKDLVAAHLKAMDLLQETRTLISNVGVGRGYSVKEVLSAYRNVFARCPEVVEKESRPGDPPQLVADVSFFQTWYSQPMNSLEQSLRDLSRRREVLQSKSKDR